MKRTRRITALILALMMVAVFAPQTSFAAKAAKSAKVLVTISDQGDFAMAKDKSPMLNKTVTVVDRNKDGQLTVDEALYAAHKAYNTTSGYSINKETGWVTKIWGKEDNFSFWVNGAYDMVNTVDQQVIHKGDMILAGSYTDTESWTDTLGYFDAYQATVTANHPLELQYCYAIRDWDAGETKEMVEDGESMVFGIWNKGNFELIEDAVVDEDGIVSFTFDKVGTYYILATGFAGDAYPVFANGCKVTVTPAADIKVNMTVSNKGTIAKTKDNKAMANKSVTVKDINKDGFLTVDEALVAAHKKYSPKTSKGYATTEGSYGLSVTKLWNVATINTLFFVNNEGLQTNVGDAIIEDGDSIVASVNADDTYYSDWYTFMDKSQDTVFIDRDVDFNISGHLGMAYMPEDMENKGIANLQLGLWSKGKVVPVADAITDEDGDAGLVFHKAGTYYVTATGTVPSKVMDYSTYEVVDNDCPIIAPICVVTVKSIKSTIAKISPWLSTVENKDEGIALTWDQDDEEIVQGYTVYRSTKKTSGFKKIADVTDGTTYLDTTAGVGKGYYYKVRAFAKEGKNTYYSKYTKTLYVDRVEDIK